MASVTFRSLILGEYLKTSAPAAARDGKKWLDQPESVWLPVMRDFASRADCRHPRDLGDSGVRIDRFCRSAPWSKRSVERALRTHGTGLVYQGRLEPPKGQLPTIGGS